MFATSSESQGKYVRAIAPLRYWAIRCPWLFHFATGVVAYLLTSVPVWLGIIFGISFVLPREADRPNAPKPDFLSACSRYDGENYQRIAEKGYSYDPDERSVVAFFPVYPLIARSAVTVTGLSALGALLLVSNLMLLSAIILFAAYLHLRLEKDRLRDGLLALVVFGLWPAGFFFRMAYSESTFLVITLLVLLGMVRRWPPVVLALLAGLATAVRPVGVAVTAAFLVHLLFDRTQISIGRRLLFALAVLPLACWGLIAYMAYQYEAFGTPLAFAQTQVHFRQFHGPDDSFGNKVAALLAAEPIWSVYVPDSLRNWRWLNSEDPIVFNLIFWNPIFFVGTLALVLLGVHKSWLTAPEIMLGLGLLVIPYLTRAYEMAMGSHARFAAVVVPAYLVIGRLLRVMPEWATWCLLGLLSLMLMAWSALFAGGHQLI